MKIKRLLLRLLRLSPVVLLVAWLWPVNNGICRWLTVFGVLGTGAAIALTAGRLWRRKRKWSYVLIAGVIGVSAKLLIVLLFSAHDDLRAGYIAELRRYDGTPYLWGGENRFGIDCSGLPRKAMRNALGKTGMRTFRPAFLLAAVKNWWFDASAKALAQGYRHELVPLNLQGTVKDGPADLLRPGDLAITDDGVHVMVFLGPDEWISADPGRGKVVIEHPSESSNPWFARPVHFYRFTLLNEYE